MVSLTGFNQATQSFQVQIGGATSAVLGAGGLAVNNGNVAAAVNAIPGFPGTVTSNGAGNTGFTLTFTQASAGVDVAPVEIVNCTCTATVRQTANGGPPPATWPAGGTVTVGSLTDTGFQVTFGAGLGNIGFSSDGHRAELRATADLWDHTRLLRPVRVARDVTLHVALSESGRGTIAFSLWDGDTLLYEQTEKALAGAFVTIR